MLTHVHNFWRHLVTGWYTATAQFWHDDDQLPTPSGGSTYSPLHLFSILVAVAAMIVYPLAYVRVNMSELGDRQLVIAALGSVGVTAVVLHVFRSFFRRLSTHFIAKISLLVLVAGFLGFGFRQDVFATDFRGFDATLVIISLVLVFLRAIVWGSWAGTLVKTLAEITGIVVVVMGIYVIGMDGSLTDNFYILNQMAVPFTNLSAYATFIPQYTNFYQYFFMVLQWLGVTNDAQFTMYIMYIFLQCMAIVAIVFAVSMLYVVMPRRSLVYAILYTVPLFFISTYPWWSSEPRYYPIQLFVYTLIPIRMVAIFGVGSICLWLFHKYHYHYGAIAAGGIVAGIAAYNSNDFGVFAVIGIGALLVFQPFAPWRRCLLQATLFVGSTVGCLVGLFALNNLVAPINGDYVFWFQRKFSNGFGGMLIQFPGNGLMVIISMFAIWICALSLYFTIRRHASIYQRDALMPLHFATLMYMTTTAICGMSYYINRSVISFQGSSMYIGLFIALFLLIQLYQRMTPHVPAYRTVRYSNLVVRVMGIMPIAIALCHTPLWNHFSSSQITLVQLQQYDAQANAITPQTDELHVMQIRAFADTLGQTQLRVAFAGAFANLVQLYTGVPAASIFDHPVNVEIDEDALMLYCNQLDTQPYDVFLTDQGYGCPNLILAKSTTTGAFFFYRPNLASTQPDAWQRLVSIAAPCTLSPPDAPTVCKN